MAPTINYREETPENRSPLPHGLYPRSSVSFSPTPSRRFEPSEVAQAPLGSLSLLVDAVGGPAHRPPYPYSTIIRFAIEGSPNQMLTLSEIYEALERRYPYFLTAEAGAGWKSSVRHNLSLNRIFEKRPRPLSEPGKGGYWVIKQGVEPGPRRVRKRRPRSKKAQAAAALETARLAAEYAAWTDKGPRQDSAGDASENEARLPHATIASPTTFTTPQPHGGRFHLRAVQYNDPDGFLRDTPGASSPIPPTADSGLPSESNPGADQTSSSNTPPLAPSTSAFASTITRIQHTATGSRSGNSPTPPGDAKGKRVRSAVKRRANIGPAVEFLVPSSTLSLSSGAERTCNEREDRDRGGYDQIW